MLCIWYHINLANFVSSPPPTTSHDRSDELEEQKEALERDYNERMENLREKLERERAEDRERYEQELEKLRQHNLFSPTSDNAEDSDASDPCRSSTYDLLQSVAYTPVRSRQDLTERVVVGREGEGRAHTPVRTSKAPPPPPSTSYVARSYQSPGSSPKLAPRHNSIAEEGIVDVDIVQKNGHTFLLDTVTEGSNGFCLVTDLQEEEVKVESDGGKDSDSG